MSGPVTRRAALRGSAVAALGLAAGVITATAAPALSANDARLVALANALQDLERRCDDHTAAHRGNRSERVQDEFDALVDGYLPLEEEMAELPADTLAGVMAKVRALDIPTCRNCESGIADSVCVDPRTSYGRGASDPVGDTGRREYGARGVAWLRNLRPSVQWDEAAEARRREIVGAHEAWTEARRAVEDATSYTAAVEVETAAAAAFNAAEDAVKMDQPRTLAGLARKALWVADLLAREAGDDDLAETFARQIAAFGGLDAARPRPGRPDAFNAGAFLADLEAAGCNVRLEIPGTRFTGDEVPTYFIAPSRGYTAVMAKWSDAIAACPDHVERVTVRLAEMRGVEL